MKYIIILISVIITEYGYSQDTLSVSCTDSLKTSNLIKLKPGYSSVIFNTPQDCDSFYIMPGYKYQLIQRDLRACKSFVELYKFYRDQVKKGDKEIGSIVDGYEGIIKTKDDAYYKLMNEYSTLNSLLDSSIVQTSSAVDLGRKSLERLDASFEVISENNKQLSKDLKAMQKINRQNKWKFGVGGFALGIIAGILIVK